MAKMTSSSRKAKVAKPVIPGRIFNSTRSSPTSLSANPGTSGRGPTKLISPFKTFHNCGSSSSFVWRKNQGTAGAYLLSVSDVEIPLEVHSFESCETDNYIEMRTTFDMVTRVLRVYHDKTIEVIFEVDIRSRNNGELWAVYSIVDAKQLCSDVHGLTWECHSEPNAPLQAKFWPMPTMAWLESKEHKMTWITGQPTGVGFDKGKMIMILDRRGNRDDARGLGQGISDTVAVDMRFGLLMNEKHDKALRVREWILNPSFYLK